jgi:hypothetical protein
VFFGLHATPQKVCEMHGLIFFLSPEWYGFTQVSDIRTSAIAAPRRRIANANAPQRTDNAIALTLTLACALAINIALLIHYLV